MSLDQLPKKKKKKKKKKNKKKKKLGILKKKKKKKKKKKPGSFLVCLNVVEQFTICNNILDVLMDTKTAES